MKIVLIGGSGLIGKKLAPLLRDQGCEVVVASPSTGVNAVTGDGLADVVRGAEVVVDVSNSPSFADDPVMNFFTTSTRHILDAEKKAGVCHHVALSVVGADRLKGSGYMRAKVAQESLIQSGGVPYTVLRATQFFEFLAAIADGGTTGPVAHLSTAPFQPVAAADVAAALADIAMAAPVNGIIELAGPESMPLAKFIERFLTLKGDPRTVIASPEANYFGAILDNRGLGPGDNPRLGSISLADWFRGMS